MIHFSVTMAESLSLSKNFKANDIKCDIHDVAEMLKSKNALDEICNPYINTTSVIGNSHANFKNESKTSSSSLITRADQELDRTNIAAMFSESEEEPEDKTTGEILLNVLCILVCIAASSMAAAFTIGVITIDPFDLLVQVRTASTEKERQRAAALVPIVERRHQLMVTLLIINAIANEALPIFIEELVPGYAAVGLSVCSVLVFGDILPTAVFSGPHKIKLSSFFVPLMKFLMCLLTPIALPISLFLDWILGHRDQSYDRNQFTALVRINYEERRRMIEAHDDTDVESSTDDDDEKKIRLLKSKSSTRQIGMDEVLLMEGALSLRSKRVNDIMKPMNQVFVLPDDTTLNKEMMLKIYVSGHSRIPVYTRKPSGNLGISEVKLIKGVLLSKQLMLVESQDNKLLSSIPLQQPICVSPDMHLVNLLQDFQQKRVSFKGGHLAIVCRDPFLATNAMDGGSPIPKDAGVLGIVTLEDVMEALLQSQITDESDRLHQAVAHSNLFSLISSSTSCLP